ncbi:hypothetical protein LCGC14_2008430 [marine sediment metagenome]|uniref:Uncharacterized protein n=1 Tax=marine sediment metagenome TaxID=412755 RepID=A0A0F9F0Z8_9ZZZZ
MQLGKQGNKMTDNIEISKIIPIELKNVGGRPPLNLDEEQIKRLAHINCTMIEIASVMKCSVRTLERGYADIIKEAKEHGKSSLRRELWKSAEKGNVTMQIWLSKQLLGMREPKNDESQEIANKIVKIINFADIKKDKDAE